MPKIALMPVFKPLISVPILNQARSQEALDRFLAAGEALLAVNRFEEAGIAEIAKRADSSVGTFYRILRDKDTLTLLLLQRFILNVEQLIDETFEPTEWADNSVADIADTAVSTLVRLHKGRMGVLRALILRASRDAEFRDRVHATNEFIARRIGGALSQHLDEITHPKPKKATRTVVHIVLGALNQHTVTGNLGKLSQRELTEELHRTFLSYLGVPA